jgi:outer membrane lipase/esterase
LLLAGSAASAAAQNFNQAIVFGDSNVDSGFYKALPDPGGGTNFNNAWAAAVAAGAGKPTSSPGLVNSEALAAFFGLTALPANQPGGTNYATSGAKNVLQNDAQTGGFQEAIPTAQQIANYLAGNGGVANPNAIYLINSGANDIAYATGQQGAGHIRSTPRRSSSTPPTASPMRSPASRRPERATSSCPISPSRFPAEGALSMLRSGS